MNSEPRKTFLSGARSTMLGRVTSENDGTPHHSMNWYYAHAGQPVGPVSEAEFDRLSATGVIQPSTLVWREGMENWRAYSTVKPSPATASALGESALLPGAVVCAECGRTFAPDQVIRFGPTPVCAGCKPLFLQKLREGAPIATGELQYGGFWIRCGAKIIDGIIVGIPLMILFFAGIFVFGLGAGMGRNPPGPAAAFASIGLQIGFQLLSLLLNGAYSVFFVTKYGATPGKMACGLKIVNPDGTRVSFGKAVGRFFAELVSGLACYIGYIIAAFDREKRTLHDHMCSTRVVRK